MKRGWLLVCGMLGCASAQAQVYQCTDSSGARVFQQQQCTGGKQIMEKSASRGPALATENSSAGSSTSADYDAATRALDIRIAIESHRPAVGMTEAQLLEAVGSPTKLNEGLVRQWIYRGPKGQSGYVYTHEGVVTSVEWPNNFRTGPSKVGSAAHRGVRGH